MKKIFLLILLMWISLPTFAGRYVIRDGEQTYVAYDERTHDDQMCHIVYERRDTVHAAMASEDYREWRGEWVRAWKKIPQLCGSIATLDQIQLGDLSYSLLMIERALPMIKNFYTN